MSSSEEVVRICTYRGVTRIIIDLRMINQPEDNTVPSPINIVLRDRLEVQWQSHMNEVWNRIIIDQPYVLEVNRQSG
jgi:hypothetical protein